MPSPPSATGCLSLQPLRTRPRPPRWPYLAAVTARPCHTRLAQAAPATGVAGLRPTGGAVTPCRKWGCDNSPSPPPRSTLPASPSQTTAARSVPSCPPSLQPTRSQRGRVQYGPAPKRPWAWQRGAWPGGPFPRGGMDGAPHRPPPGRTRAVARQQGVAVEAGRARLAAGPGGVSQAAAAGARQRVAVLEQQVGVAVAAAVAGLARAAQHHRVPEEARRAPGARAGSAAGAGRTRVLPAPGPTLGCCAGRAHARPAAHRSQEVPA